MLDCKTGAQSSTAVKMTDENPTTLRNLYPMQKEGERRTEGDTDAAHHLGIKLFQDTLKSLPGRPVTNEETKRDIMEGLNGFNNLRIKSAHGNRSTDCRRENEISGKVATNELLSRDASVKAIQIVRNLEDAEHSTTQRVVEKIGDMRTINPETGRPISIASLAAPVAPLTDKRSSAVQSGDLKFRLDGKVDQRSSAVKDGTILVRNDGHVDQRSKGVRNGAVSQKPSACSTLPAPTSTTTMTSLPSSVNSTSSSLYSHYSPSYSSSSYSSGNSGTYVSSSPSSVNSNSSSSYSHYSPILFVIISQLRKHWNLRFRVHKSEWHICFWLLPQEVSYVINTLFEAKRGGPVQVAPAV